MKRNIRIITATATWSVDGTGLELVVVTTNSDRAEAINALWRRSRLQSVIFLTNNRVQPELTNQEIKTRMIEQIETWRRPSKKSHYEEVSVIKKPHALEKGIPVAVAASGWKGEDARLLRAWRWLGQGWYSCSKEHVNFWLDGGCSCNAAVHTFSKTTSWRPLEHMSQK